jgi:ADP-ribosylation factor-binding protein GGA
VSSKLFCGIEVDLSQELANALISAHPKIQRMCEEESDDHEAVAKLLEINDSIHRTIERYKLIKNGDVEGAAKIPKGTLGTSGAGVTKGPNNELSLIDLGDDPIVGVGATSTSTSTKPKGSSLEDDLLGLSMDDSTVGAISLGGSNGFRKFLVNHHSEPSNVSASSSSNQPQQLSNAQITSLFSQSQASPAPQVLNASQSLFSSQSPKPSQHVQPPPKADPFASLTSSQHSRQASPFQFQQSIQPPSLLAAKPPQNPVSQPSLISTTTESQDDEWNFASALPVQTPSTLTLTNSSIQIAWELSRSATNPSIIEIKSKISNNTASPVSNFTFQVAVTKVSTRQTLFRYSFANPS